MDKTAKLITDNAELLIYLDGKLHITILGGIKLTGLDRMKVTLKLTSTEHKQNAFRHNLDLYNSIQTEQLIEKSAEALDVSTNEISTAISQLTTSLENYRAERLEAMKPKQVEKKQLTEPERKAAITYLKSPDLLTRTKQAIAQSGLVGEETNALIAYLTYTSRKRHLYNGKELQVDLANQYDYGARFYDPLIARWNVIDPMAENHYNVNPYNYVLNNPLIYYDQYGLDTGKVNPKPEPVHQLKEVTITAKKESKSSGFGLAALGIASRVKNVPKWLWVTDTFDQEVPVLDVLTDALTLYYLSKDIKPAIVKSSPAIPDAKDLPWDKGKSPGEDWTWKGKGDATTKEQRESVQGKPCATCGASEGKRIADHKTPLVKEHYETGKIDKEKMRSKGSVQPQCSTCSAKQGAEMSKYSKDQKKVNGYQ